MSNILDLVAARRKIGFVPSSLMITLLCAWRSIWVTIRPPGITQNWLASIRVGDHLKS
jgi:hypothetical protein